MKTSENYDKVIELLIDKTNEKSLKWNTVSKKNKEIIFNSDLENISGNVVYQLIDGYETKLDNVIFIITKEIFLPDPFSDPFSGLLIIKDNNIFKSIYGTFMNNKGLLNELYINVRNNIATNEDLMNELMEKLEKI